MKREVPGIIRYHSGCEMTFCSCVIVLCAKL